MAKLTAEQVAGRIDETATAAEANDREDLAAVLRGAERLVRANLVESPDERRERFERWYCGLRPDAPKGYSPDRRRDGRYFSDALEGRWQAFSAALDYRVPASDGKAGE